MRFVWAVAAFVLATLMIGAGLTQRTVLSGPDTQTDAIEVEQEAPYILVDGSVLTRHDGLQTLNVEGDGTIFGAFARTIDAEAWLARTDYISVTTDADGEIVTEYVEASDTGDQDASEDGASDEESSDSEPAALEPEGSDLWLEEFTEENEFETSVQLPEGSSMLLASDGVEPAPTTLSVTWPTGATAPWSGPLIVGGIIMAVVGLILYFLGLRKLRRSKGPRRKGLPKGKDTPDQDELTAGEDDKGVISESPSRRQLTGGRGFIAIPVLLGALAVTGCSPSAWPDFSETPTPTPTETIVAPDDQPQPAVTEAQAETILARISDTVSQADEDLDIDLASERLAGPALQTRETNYTLRDAIDDHPEPAALPAEPLEVLLPEAFDGWPRTFLAVVEDPDTQAATIMTASQEDPWSDYKVTHIAQMGAETELPDLAPDYVGASQVPPDSPFLVVEPQQLAEAYADVIDNGDDSEYVDLFDADSDALRTFISDDRKTRLEEFNETGDETGDMEFSTKVADDSFVSFTTVDSGAIVAITLKEREVVTATDDDAVIKLPEENEAARELTGEEESAEGFETDFLDQVFFYVPSEVTGGQVRLLGYSSSLLDVSEVE